MRKCVILGGKVSGGADQSGHTPFYLHSFTHARILKARKSMSIPAAIITKLEDCPDWLDRRLAKACREAEYHLELSAVVIAGAIPKFAPMVESAIFHL